MAAAPNDGWFNYVPYALARIQSRAQHGFLCAGDDLPRRFRRRSAPPISSSPSCGCARPACRLNRVPILDLGHDDRSRSAICSPCPRSASRSSCCGWTASSARISSTRTAAAIRCCGSICSGCSRTPGSTSSCCRRWVWFPIRCPSSAAARSSAIPPWWSARSRRWCSALASGCTTCSRPAFRFSRSPFSAALPSSSPFRARSPCSRGSRRSGPGGRC